MPRGGYRPGAGRKVSPTGRRNRVVVWLDDAHHQHVIRKAEEQGTDPPTYVRRLIETDAAR